MPRAPNLHEHAALALRGRVFEIDPEGRIWRIEAHGRPCARHRAEYPDSGGYLLVFLILPEAGRVEILAHRLVYEALVRPIPEGYIVWQRNGDRKDNRPENLVATPAGFRGKGRRELA